MALGYTAAGQAGTDPTFSVRVQAALIAAATAILNEGATTSDHPVRYRFALRVKANSLPYIAGLSVDVAMQNSVQSTYNSLAAIPDSEIQNQVNGLFTNLAYSVILPG